MDYAYYRDKSFRKRTKQKLIDADGNVSYELACPSEGEGSLLWKSLFFHMFKMFSGGQ